MGMPTSHEGRTGDELAALRARVAELEHEIERREAAAAAGAPLLATTGRGFLQALAAHFGNTLGADRLLIARRVDDDPALVRSESWSARASESAVVDHAYAGSLCEYVLDQRRAVFVADGRRRFASDRSLRDHEFECVAALPLVSRSGAAVGMLAVLWREPPGDADAALAPLQRFAPRAAAELEREHADERLRRSEALLRSMLDHSAAPIYVKDLGGCYRLVNRAFLQAVQLPLERILGNTPDGFLPPRAAAEIADHEAEVLRRQAPVRRVIELPLPGQAESATFLIDKVPLFDETGGISGTCTIATEITEQKRLEAQLVRAQRLESVGQLAGGIAHDFNNLLTAIGGYTTLALEALPETAPVRAELGEAMRAIERAGALTAQLLAFARKQVIQPRDVDLVTLLQGLTGLLQPLLGASIVLRLRLGPGLWPLHVDSGQMEQVLMNLALNARDAMPAGGALEISAANVTLEQAREVRGEALPPGDYVELRVRDTGTGIPAEVQPRLFEPFFTTKPHGQGSGLGLAMCHGIVRQSGGHIDFESRPGAGTTFVILLPRGRAVASAAPQVSAEPRPRGRETVLVVEDERAVRALVARTLSESGYVVIQAEDGVAALETAGAWPGVIDLLVTDVVMPRLGGLELATRLQARWPRLKVLLVTAHYTQERTDEAAPQWNTLLKPCSMQQLAEAVRAVLDDAQGTLHIPLPSDPRAH